MAQHPGGEAGAREPPRPPRRGRRATLTPASRQGARDGEAIRAAPARSGRIAARPGRLHGGSGLGPARPGGFGAGRGTGRSSTRSTGLPGASPWRRSADPMPQAPVGHSPRGRWSARPGRCSRIVTGPGPWGVSVRRAEPSAWTAAQETAPGAVALRLARADPQKAAGSARRSAATPSGSGPSRTATSAVRPGASAGATMAPGAISTPLRARAAISTSAAGRSGPFWYGRHEAGAPPSGGLSWARASGARPAAAAAAATAHAAQRRARRGLRCPEVPGMRRSWRAEAAVRQLAERGGYAGSCRRPEAAHGVSSPGRPGFPPAGRRGAGTNVLPGRRRRHGHGARRYTPRAFVGTGRPPRYPARRA